MAEYDVPPSSRTEVVGVGCLVLDEDEEDEGNEEDDDIYSEYSPNTLIVNVTRDVILSLLANNQDKQGTVSDKVAIHSRASVKGRQTSSEDVVVVQEDRISALSG